MEKTKRVLKFFTSDGASAMTRFREHRKLYE